MSTNNRKIAIVYIKDPNQQQSGMDIIRWNSISRALAKLKYEVDMVSVNANSTKILSKKIRIVPISKAKWRSYCAVKVCYQNTIQFIPEHELIITRLARVVSPSRTYRDRSNCDELFRNQKKIANLSKAILVNDQINRERWYKYFGHKNYVEIVPTGCPRKMYISHQSGIKFDRPSALFMGSLCHKRTLTMLNEIGRQLKKRHWQLIVIGLNKTKSYCGNILRLDDDSCHYLGSVPEHETISYINACRVGIALASSPYLFENETSKIYYYLRYGLPIVAEDRISNLRLLSETNWGCTFRYGDCADALKNIFILDKNINRSKAPSVMEYMAINHSWDLRAKTLDSVIRRFLYV